MLLAHRIKIHPSLSRIVPIYICCPGETITNAPFSSQCPGLDEKNYNGHPSYKGNESKCGVTKNKEHLCFKRIDHF